MQQVNVGINGFGRIAWWYCEAWKSARRPCGYAPELRNADPRKDGLLCSSMIRCSVGSGARSKPPRRGIRVNGKDIRVFSETRPLGHSLGRMRRQNISWNPPALSAVGRIVPLHFVGGAKKKVVLTAPARG